MVYKSLMTLDDLAFDRRHIWHPYTSMTSPLPVYPVVSAHGCELSLAGGEQLVDGMSSWWAAIHGYNHPRLNAALKGQIDQMSHVMFGGITHPPAVALCRQLVAMTPASLECVFLADSGSVAVEVAMKMALQYWQAKGEPRRRFLTFRNGYHGDTFGAMSVCDPQNSMHSLWQGYLPDNLFAPAPQSRFDGEWDEMDMVPFARLMAAHRHEIAAVILEPIVQGAGGMRMYHPEWLKRVRKMCDREGILLIADEIATGFGRTGSWFAFEQDGVVPDLVTFAKGVNAGYVPAGGVLISEPIARYFDDHFFAGGLTYSGHPLAMAAIVATIDAMKEEKVVENAASIGNEVLRPGLEALAEKHAIIGEVRGRGLFQALELVSSREQKTPLTAADMAAIKGALTEAGLLAFVVENRIHVVPPCTITAEQVAQGLAIFDAVFARFASLAK